jgi:hypothetical protein
LDEKGQEYINNIHLTHSLEESLVSSLLCNIFSNSILFVFLLFSLIYLFTLHPNIHSPFPSFSLTQLLPSFSPHPTLPYQVTAALGTSSPAEARQGGSVGGTGSTGRQ